MPCLGIGVISAVFQIPGNVEDEREALMIDVTKGSIIGRQKSDGVDKIWIGSDRITDRITDRIKEKKFKIQNSRFKIQNFVEQITLE